jgi:hypothetical protein
MKKFCRSLNRRGRLLAMVFVTLGLVGSPGVLLAHAVVYPKKTVTKGYEKYVLRVPNEKDVATTRVEIRFPKGLRVTSFGDVNGWTLEVITDSSKAIVGAVWTGNLPPKRFVEFPFVAANPKTKTKLSWPAFQTYASGERVEWVGPEGSKRPASSTMVAPESALSPVVLLSGGAFLLSLIALGLAMRPRGNSAQESAGA